MDGQVYSEVSLTNSLDFHQSTSELGDNLNSSIVDPTGIGTHQKFDKDPLALEPQYHGKEQQSSGRSTQELEFGNENPEFSTTLQTTPSISDEENGRHKEFINLQTPGFRRSTNDEAENLTVNDVNDGPVASDDVGSGDEDSVISGNVLSNDSDVDGTIEVQNTGIFDTDHGSITVNADGSYEYETMAWSGTLSFDTSEAELSVVATGQEDTAISLNIQSALSDSSETHTILIMDVPEGSEISAGTDNGDVTWSLSPEDLVGLTITPPKEFSGSFDLTIAAQSADGDDIATTTETLRVVVSDVNDGLVASDDDNDNISGSAGDDTIKGGDGSDHLEFIANMGNDTADGGVGGSWTDTLELSGFEGNGPDEGWTLSLNSGSTIEGSDTDGELLLSEDANGKITFDDGGSLDFDNMEKIVW